jgi:hypothetical protein
VLVLTALVGTATYFEFAYGRPSPYAVVLWVVAVPLLFSTAVRGVRDHPLYRPVAYAGFVVIGIVQYLGGEWVLLAALFVLGGAVGLVSRLRDRLRPAPS